MLATPSAPTLSSLPRQPTSTGIQRLPWEDIGNALAQDLDPVEISLPDFLPGDTPLLRLLPLHQCPLFPQWPLLFWFALPRLMLAPPYAPTSASLQRQPTSTGIQRLAWEDIVNPQAIELDPVGIPLPDVLPGDTQLPRLLPLHPGALLLQWKLFRWFALPGLTLAPPSAPTSSSLPQQPTSTGIQRPALEDIVNPLAQDLDPMEIPLPDVLPVETLLLRLLPLHPGPLFPE